MTGPVDTFVNTSQNFRSHKRLSHDLTNTYRDNIANILSNRGAIAAFNDMTIKKRFSSSEVVMPLESNTESHLQKPDFLFDKTDAFKSGVRREPDIALSSMPSCTGAVSAMASAIVIADTLTVPTLAKITSSKRFPDNIVFR